MKATYTVKNVYSIAGESRHLTPDAALKAAKKREGIGWIVTDQDGNQWDYTSLADNTPVITQYAD